MLLTSVGVEPATSWSSVGWRIQLSHRGRQFAGKKYDVAGKKYDVAGKKYDVAGKKYNFMTKSHILLKITVHLFVYVHGPKRY